jgi:hypothetical protein
MENVSGRLKELQRLVETGGISKQQVSDLAWLLENPEYEHRVVDIRTFITSPDYLNCGKECWPSIIDDLEALFSGDYDEAVFCEAIGAGKSFKSSIIITYMVYRVLCLKSPQAHFQFASGSRIYFINMSVRAEQSKKVVFVEIKARIDNSPWFRNNYPSDPNINSELRFAKGIVIFPGNSKETFPLGFNVLGAVMDEASFYNDTPGHDVAEEMFNALHSRVKNRFGEAGMVVMISSPRYKDDFVERKTEEAKTNPKIFSRRKMFWEAKPLEKFSGKWVDFQGHKIPAEYKVDAERNPEVFKRDFMAIASLVVEPYIKQMDLVRKQIDTNRKHPLDEFNRYLPWFKGNPNYVYCMHIDLSFNTCRTGMCLAHREGDNTAIDMMVGVNPPKGGEIDYDGIENMVLSLRERGFNISLCTYDSYQSQGSIQRLNKKGIKTELLSVDRNMECYETLKEGLYSGKIILYDYPLFFSELERLELKAGNKVDHPPVNHGSKDVTDAVAGAVHSVLQNKSFPSFGVAGGAQRFTQTEQDKIKEASVQTADGTKLVYGRYSGKN